MKKALIFFLLLHLGCVYDVKACTCSSFSPSFKESLYRQRDSQTGLAVPHHYVVKGIITEYFPNAAGGRIVVLDQYMGTMPFTGDTVTFRSGNGANCIDPLIADNQGDTLIISMFRLSEDIPGLTPPAFAGEFMNMYCEVNYMRIGNGLVSGWINGVPAFPVADLKDSIDNFLNNLLTVDNLSGQRSSITISPNPVSEQLQLSHKGTTAKEVKLYDLNGRLLLTQDFVNNEATMNTRELSPGMYLITITDKEGQVYRKKLMKK